MSIALAVFEWGKEAKKAARISFDADVVHLGRQPPVDKQCVALRGEGIADHHGKLFYAYGSYRYVNLTARPTQVSRGPAIAFQLDPFMPQCEVQEGDRLKLGSAVVEITSLKKPRPREARPAAEVRKRLDYEYLDCGACKKAALKEDALKVVRLTGELAYLLRDYTRCHEILRATADWLADLFGRRKKDMGLALGFPHAIAIRPRAGAPAAWDEFEIAVEKGISRRNATVRRMAPRSLPPELFDRGLPFRFRGPGVVGVGAGILEEAIYEEGRPRAGHFMLMQYPRGKKPARNDLCILHHTAASVSDMLNTIYAAGLRQARELERRGGMASRFLFHDISGICSLARAAVSGAKEALGTIGQGAASDLLRAEGHLETLQRHVEWGERLFAETRGIRPRLVSLERVCRNAVDRVFDDSISLRDHRRWYVGDLTGGKRQLRAVPCDELGIERCVCNLLHNANDAADQRCEDLVTKRIHVYLDAVRRDRLKFARIRVADDGPGLSPNALSSLFEGRFSTKIGGHGLGGQVVAEQIRRHYGAIEVTSKQGMGTVVGLLLPTPARWRDNTLEDVERSLTPYHRRATQRPLVVRAPWASVLRADRFLSNWYKQQGRQCV